jgi:molybdenum-dependent DNA-binding transcriptional regulator ModE
MVAAPMEHLLMSQKERTRMGVMKQVKAKLLSIVAAGKLLGLSYRQAKRIWCRYRDKGDKGLVHRGRGRTGNRCKATRIRERILARYKERYADFGPTLAAEHLGREGLVIDHETLRLWLLAKGWWTIKRRRQKHRQWRERKACFGELVQMDGSHHDWFEGRRGPAVLMVMIDDATNRTYAQFSEQETTRAAYDTFEGYVRRHKMPVGLYVDRDSIYRADREPTVAEQLAGQEPLTQFGRAMKGLGVAIELAYSPQAKGRVERRNGLLQDRLVKELRLAGISDLKGANHFLEEKFLPDLNRRFWVKPAQEADAHRAVPRNLAELLNWEQERVVQRDWTVAWEGRWFQIESGHEALCLVGRSVIVRQLRDGTVHLVREGQKLNCRELAQRPTRAAQRKPLRTGASPIKPKAAHPWRQFGTGVGKEFWRGVKARASAARQLSPGPRSASASLRPHSVPGRVAKKSPVVNNRTKGDIFS